MAPNMQTLNFTTIWDLQLVFLTTVVKQAKKQRIAICSVL